MQVDFHFNVTDPLVYTCRLVRKALSKGVRLVVCASVEELVRIDHQLWALGDAAFLPHAGLHAAVHVTERSPVWLRNGLTGGEPVDLLVNLLPNTPQGHERFDRLIEIVSTREADRAHARERWRAHTAMGLVPNRFDVGAHRV